MAAPKRQLPSELGAAIRADLGESLDRLIDEALNQTLELITRAQARKQFWARTFNGAARGNKLGMYYAQSEENWLVTHEAQLAALHGALQAIDLYLQASGRR